MHSLSSRVQNVFGFFTTVAFCIAALTSLSVVLYPSAPTASVSITDVEVIRGRPQYSSAKQQEYAFLTLSLDADLTSLFNWNTKQVFAYLTVSYPRTRGSKWSENEVTVWDMIVRSKEEARVSLKEEKAKYQINDIAGRFLERNATVRFAWNVQPHVGALTWGAIESTGVDAEEKGEAWRFKFPEVGPRKAKKVEKKVEKKAEKKVEKKAEKKAAAV